MQRLVVGAAARTGTALPAVPSGLTHQPRPAQPLSRRARSSRARASAQMRPEIGGLAHESTEQTPENRRS